jgi:hypothetical protein
LDPAHAEDGLVHVTREMRPSLDTRRLLDIGSQRLESVLRCTFRSGYTQFGPSTVPVVSQYSITSDEYETRQDKMPWPTSHGAFVLRLPSSQPSSPPPAQGQPPGPEPKPKEKGPTGFIEDFENEGPLPPNDGQQDSEDE